MVRTRRLLVGLGAVVCVVAAWVVARRQAYWQRITDFTSIIVSKKMSDHEAEERMAEWAAAFVSPSWIEKKCLVDRSADLYRPIPEVVAEHPELSGYCIFGLYAWWLAPAHMTMMKRSYEWGDANVVRTDTPLKTFTFAEGVSIRAHDNGVFHDGPYCYALGWLKNQGLDEKLFSDFDAWNKIAAEECKRQALEFNFTAEELTMAWHIRKEGVLMQRHGCSMKRIEEPCDLMSIREAKSHAHAKCLLGGFGTEMIYCYSFGCLVDGNRVAHGAECKYSRPADWTP